MYMYYCDDHNYRHIIIIFTLYSQWLFFLNVINSIFFFFQLSAPTVYFSEPHG